MTGAEREGRAEAVLEAAQGMHPEPWGVRGREMPVAGARDALANALHGVVVLAERQRATSACRSSRDGG